MTSKFTQPILDSNPLFVGLAQEDRILLNQSSMIMSFSKQESVYQPGSDANKAYILLKGAAKVTVHSEKKDIIKYLIRPGMMFGESFLTGEKTRRDFAYIMDDYTELVEVDSQALLTIMRRNFTFAQSLLFFLGERLRYTENQLENVVLKDSKSRIMDYLHQMGVEQGKPIGFETLVKHNMTHQDIADVTGTSRQMVTAVLNHLKRSNILHFNRKKILFRNLEALPSFQ